MARDSNSLVTFRLLLRPPIMEDAEAIFTGYAQDSEVTRYLVWRRTVALT